MFLVPSSYSFIQDIKTTTILLLFLCLTASHARPHHPDLTAIKTMAGVQDMELLGYDGRERTREEMEEGNRRMRPAYRMPEKMGNIVDGEFVPFDRTN